MIPRFKLSSLTQKSILLTISNENSEALVFIFVSMFSYFTENGEGQRGTVTVPGSHRSSASESGPGLLQVYGQDLLCPEQPPLMDRVLISMLVLTNREASQGALYGFQHICDRQRGVFAELMVPQLI